ncbi:MAG: SH3 domain-containing protein [Myxococcales bacterium]
MAGTMLTVNESKGALKSMVLAACIVALGACGGEAGVVESEELTGADETAELSSELSASTPVGTVLVSTTGVNLRSGPSTEYRVLLVVPQGATVVTVERTAPSNGFYKVKYNGTIGWTHGGYYNVKSVPTNPGTTSGPRDTALVKAKAGVGFSYWWGHGRWRPEGPTASTKGSCSGNCPSCSHSGSYGADCSGYVAKVWGLGNADLTVDSHPYSTYHFDNQTTHWNNISRSNLKKADALVYNSNGAGHIVLYESGDGWGSMWALECKGCSYGCVRNLRTVGSEYKAIARRGW